MKVRYLAFRLKAESRTKLGQLFQPKWEDKRMDHVTIFPDLSKVSLSDLEEFLKQKPEVRAYGWAQGRGVDCIACSVGGHTERHDGSFYHITMSVADGHKAVESNDLLERINIVRGVYPVHGEYVVAEREQDGTGAVITSAILVESSSTEPKQKWQVIPPNARHRPHIIVDANNATGVEGTTIHVYDVNLLDQTTQANRLAHLLNKYQDET